MMQYHDYKLCNTLFPLPENHLNHSKKEKVQFFLKSSLINGHLFLIETKSEYKQQGLGMIVANKMIQYTLEQGKGPVWACHYKNTASERMAEKLGFSR